MENEPIRWSNNDLAQFIKDTLPMFFKAVVEEPSDTVIMHQDAFAVNMESNEFFLLGAAIKFAGNYKKEVRIIGTNRETVKDE